VGGGCPPLQLTPHSLISQVLQHLPYTLSAIYAAWASFCAAWVGWGYVYISRHHTGLQWGNRGWRQGDVQFYRITKWALGVLYARVYRE